jgi:ribonuclease BN (tRNA processing enzyme)
MGYPDLIFTPWLMGRRTPLTVYGPKGLKAMTGNILKAWQVDLDVRTQGGHARPPCKVDAHEIAPGVVYEDRNITVTAFPVHHGDALDAFGYRIETPDRTIVLSGDTAHPLATFGSVSAAWQEFRRTHHTSSKELADIANIVKPGLLVIYHHSNAGNGPSASDSEEVLIEEIQRVYKGRVVCGHDLDVF